MLGLLDNNIKDVELSCEFYRKAILTFSNSVDNEKWAGAHGGLANSLSIMYEISKDEQFVIRAIEMFEIALNYRERVADWIGWANVQINWAMTEVSIGDRDGSNAGLVALQRAVTRLEVTERRLIDQLGDQPTHEFVRLRHTRLQVEEGLRRRRAVPFEAGA